MKNDLKINGKDYWRSLEQLADTPEFKAFLQREIPKDATELKNGLSRRKFLSLMGASMAFAGLAGCRRPVERVMPYVKAPENIIPGMPQYYATTMPFGLNSFGLVVESHEGRPTKIEGNEKHPSSLGKSNAITQASILGLYDPDRAKQVKFNGDPKEWAFFSSFWINEHAAMIKNKGKDMAVLSQSFSSPTLFRLYNEFGKQFPLAKWYSYEPISDENIINGLRLATGKNYQPVYDYKNARVILSLDADFLQNESEAITAAAGFAAGRHVRSVNDTMNRLYVVETNFSLTGGMADHRLRIQTREISAFTLALVKELQRQGLSINIDFDFSKENYQSFNNKWIKETVRDLLNNRGSGLVVAGRNQPENVHTLVFQINKALQNNGQTVRYVEVENTVLPSAESISKLSNDIGNGEVSTLIIFGGNPVYTAPADLNFASALDEVKTTIHISHYFDETSNQVNWHLPLSHYLEEWGDARSADGTLSVIQPLILPLFDTRGSAEVVSLLVTGKETKGYDLLRSTWGAYLSKISFEDEWRQLLHDGVLSSETKIDSEPQSTKFNLNQYLMHNPLPAETANLNNLEIVFRQSPVLFDGRFANNGWLQELPDTVTKLTWDNALLMSPQTANEMRLNNEDMVECRFSGSMIKIPVWILPGHADYSITATLGYGRNFNGRIASGIGFNTYKLRTTKAFHFGIGARIQKTHQTYKLASTQDHGSMEGRPLVREATLDEYKTNPTFAPDMVKHPELKSLWEERAYDKGYQWGMAIDLNACIGCNACTIACQSENNIPIIGKEHVRNGREMHWIRIDRYFSGGPEDPDMVFQPVACLHCEMAPCEQVCPVAATSHDEEGLNLMTYNRCVGTRYCSNNCPFKVRRFNFFNFTKDYPELLKMMQNPDVTVRSRGVMEKCTFCTQRINEAKINAKNDGRELQDGEVVTACQQTCPTDAIVFGNINDPDSKVSQVKNQNREYAMLSELNLKTRSTYLAKLRNPNPALIKKDEGV